MNGIVGLKVSPCCQLEKRDFGGSDDAVLLIDGEAGRVRDGIECVAVVAFLHLLVDEFADLTNTSTRRRRMP